MRGSVGAGFAGKGTSPARVPLSVNHEDGYAIDRCFGDKVLEESIAVLADLANRE